MRNLFLDDNKLVWFPSEGRVFPADKYDNPLPNYIEPICLGIRWNGPTATVNRLDQKITLDMKICGPVAVGDYLTLYPNIVGVVQQLDHARQQVVVKVVG